MPSHWLSLAVWVPIVAGLIVLAVGDRNLREARGVSLLGAIVGFLVTIPLVTVLEEKYGFDRFYDWFFAGGARRFGNGLWRFGDVTVIDGLMVNGSASLIGWFAGLVRLVQSGFIYHYAFFMIIGVSMLLTYFIFFRGTLVP